VPPLTPFPLCGGWEGSLRGGRGIIPPGPPSRYFLHPINSLNPLPVGLEFMEFFGLGLEFGLFFGDDFGRGLGQEVFVAHFALGLADSLPSFSSSRSRRLASSVKSMIPRGHEDVHRLDHGLAAAAGGLRPGCSGDPGCGQDLDRLPVAVKCLNGPGLGAVEKDFHWVPGGTFISPRILRMAVMAAMTRFISASAPGGRIGLRLG